MLPRRLFTFTPGIQIRGQPIKNYKKKIKKKFKFFSNFFYIKQLFSADAKPFSKKKKKIFRP
jgi:hypothetical protein